MKKLLILTLVIFSVFALNNVNPTKVFADTDTSDTQTLTETTSTSTDTTEDIIDTTNNALTLAATSTCPTDTVTSCEPMTLTVIKVVVGGTAKPEDFTITVSGGSATPGTFQGNASGTAVLIDALTPYTVTENSGGPAGYTATYSSDCSTTSFNNFHPKTCVVTNTYTETPATNTPGTIVATKIVCANESDLPNWSGNPMTIGSNTANDFVATHPNCHLESGWQFQVRYWGASDQHGHDIPSVPYPGGAYVGEAGAPWTTISGVTDSNGVVTTTFDTTNVWHFWVREVLKDGYIPFSSPDGNSSSTDAYSTAFPDNEVSVPSSDVSAEIYCGSDVMNYNNVERVDGVFNPGETYYCVAFNVPKPETHEETGSVIVTKVVINDNKGTKQVSDFPLFVGSTGVTSGATTTMAVGNYVVSETFNSSEYTQSFSGDCDSSGNIVVQVNKTTSCVITNNDRSSGGGGNHHSSGGGTVLGVSTENPQVLGVADLPGLPNTGSGPITNSSANLELIMAVSLMTLLGLNVISLKLLSAKK